MSSASGSSPASGSGAIRVGVIGAGAVVRHFHRPVLRELARRDEVTVVGVTDPRVEEARRVAEPHGWPVLPDLDSVLAAGAELVLLAGPPGVRAEQARKVLAAGRHVLAEKPLAGSADEAGAIATMAEAAPGQVAVGHYRRFLGAFERAGEWLRGGHGGAVRRIEIAEGGKFDWPVSPAFFNPRLTPGGVWADLGVHVLDQLLAWWGEPDSIDYRDDAAPGGQEANAWATLRWAGGREVCLRLSRDWPTSSSWRLIGERGELRIDLRDSGAATVRLAADASGAQTLWRVTGASTDAGVGADGPAEPQAAALVAQWRDVLAAVRSGRPPRVDARAGAAAVAWVERGYAARRRVRPVWEAGCDRIWQGVTGPVAVIGASGFIGTHLVSGLVAAGVAVRPVVRSASSLARVARWPDATADARIADPANAAALTGALRGARAVVYAAIGDSAGLARQAVALATAARAAGVGRVVYLSSAMVHGPRPPSGTDEASPLSPDQPTRYAAARVRAEEALLKAWGGDTRGLVRLRPGIVYGARSRWITDLAAALRAGRAGWLAGGAGVCDAVAVENVAAAVAAALRAGDAGGAYHVADAEPVIWRDFYAAVAESLGLGLQNVTDMPDRPVAPEQVNRWREEIRPALSARLGPLVPGAAKGRLKALGAAWRAPLERPDRFVWPIAGGVWLPDEWLLLQGASWRLPTARARAELGWEPVVSFAEGMRRALAWRAVAEDGADAGAGEEAP